MEPRQPGVFSVSDDIFAQFMN